MNQYFCRFFICLILKLNVHERMLGKGRLQASNKEISGMNPEMFLTVYGLVECNQETGFVSVQ